MEGIDYKKNKSIQLFLNAVDWENDIQVSDSWFYVVSLCLYFFSCNKTPLAFAMGAGEDSRMILVQISPLRHYISKMCEQLQIYVITHRFVMTNPTPLCPPFPNNKLWEGGKRSENGMSQGKSPATSHFQMILHPNAHRGNKQSGLVSNHGFIIAQMF
jgi:hypothetical protein